MVFYQVTQLLDGEDGLESFGAGSRVLGGAAPTTSPSSQRTAVLPNMAMGAPFDGVSLYRLRWFSDGLDPELQKRDRVSLKGDESRLLRFL